MTFGWLSIIRLGIAQMALGAIVVLTNSTLNRLMVVELALPAVLPGLLVGLHYGVQLSRPGWGFLSDAGGRRAPFIIGGIATLGLGATLAAWAVTLFPAGFATALALSVAGYALVGLGAGAAGTSTLALLADGTAPKRRAAAGAITWLMMIAGIAITAGVAGGLLAPYSATRLMQVVIAVCAFALTATALAVAGLERGLARSRAPARHSGFRAALAEAWADPRARGFTIFVFLSMVAYFMQELILEPYAGLVAGFTPGQSTQLSGAQHGGVFAGMLSVGIMASGLGIGSMRAWVAGGCLASALALALIAASAPQGSDAPLVPLVVALGFANGVFAVAAIGTMMQLAGDGGPGREGTRMGLWGAAQAIAAGTGALAGAVGADAMRLLVDDATAFGTVFLVEAALFATAAVMALRILRASTRPARRPMMAGEVS
jgi:BCD family chlorophyll transporter-like MFS transporter